MTTQIAFLLFLGCCTFPMVGCGGGGNQVIEAPEADEVDEASAGMTEEDYTKEMEKDMTQ